jgi:uncharacterized protein YggE
MNLFKKIIIITVSFFSLVAMAESEHHVIVVNGLAERTIEPNMVILRVESWAKATSAKKAQEQQALQFTNFKKSLEKFKIKKEDIQTESYNVNPEYVYDQKTRNNRIDGYRVSHSIVVTYRKVEDAGQFLDEVVTSKGETSGINVNGVSWDSDKKAEAELSALGDAVRNARKRADELAEAAKVKIKGVHKIQHSSYNAPVARPYMAKAAMMEMSADAAPTEVAGGQIKVTVEVNLEYEID